MNQQLIFERQVKQFGDIILTPVTSVNTYTELLTNNYFKVAIIGYSALYEKTCNIGVFTQASEHVYCPRVNTH